jgi:recombination associated protein RdgC
MQLMDRVRKTEFLGQEFLLWLWFRMDTDRARFDLGDTGTADLWLGRRIVLQAESDEGVEKITCSGGNPVHLKEARLALTENKAVTEALLRLSIGEDEWAFVMDSTWMNFKSFKTPKVTQDQQEDPEGFFYEKFFLVDQAVSAMDQIYASFIKLRISPQWESQELPAMREWIRKGR